MSDTNGIASPRIIGPASYILLLARIPLIASVVLIATLSDWAIPGSMREALRYSIVDQPHQLWVIAVALALACAAVRFTCEATIELVSPDLFDAPGGVGRMAHLLPRMLAFLIGVAAGLPILMLAADPIGFGPDTTDAIRWQAAGFGFLYVAIGAVIGLIARGPHTPHFAVEKPSALLRWMIALLPLVPATIFVGAAVGFWQADSGTAYHVLERYISAILGSYDQGSALAPYVDHAGARYDYYIHHKVLDDPFGPKVVVPTVGPLLVIAELISLFVACAAARLAIAVFLDLTMPRLGRSGGLGRIIRLWLPRLASTAVGFVLAALVWLHYLGPAGPADLSPNERWWGWGIAATFALIGLLASIGGGSGIASANTAWHETKSVGRKCMGAAERLAALDDRWQWLFAAAIVAGVLVFIVFVDIHLVEVTQWFGPVAIILLWGFVATNLFFPVAYLAHITRLPLILILLLSAMTFAGFDLNDNHELRLAKEPQAPDQMHLLPTQHDERDSLDLASWLGGRADWDKYDHYPVFLVATEGGGIRAAYFTASILAALQERCPAFAQHTLAISGVSGGSVGASVFAALAADQAKNAPDAQCNLAGAKPGSLVGRARRVMSTDLLSPLLGATLFPDALQRILPFPVPEFDRSRALEYAMQASWSNATTGDCGICDKGRFSEKVLALYPQKTPRSAVPHLFLNTTEAGTGRVIPYATILVPSLATPFREEAQIDDAAFDPVRPSPSALERLALQDRMPDDRIALSTAAILSARFPYLTPAGRLGRSGGHYVDGGYFENSGTWLLSGLVQNLIGQQLSYKPGESPLKDAARNAVFIVVVVQSAPCTRTSYEEGCAEDQLVPDSSWNEAMSPLRALLFTRDKRAEYSFNDLSGLTAMIEQLSARAQGSGAAPTVAEAASKEATRKMPPGLGCDYPVCAVTLRFRNAAKTDIPLSWLLSGVARYSMDSAVDKMERTDVRKLDTKTAGQLPGNNVLGSYQRIVCLLALRKGEQGCLPALPPVVTAAAPKNVGKKK